jgi:hypothetical protein
VLFNSLHIGAAVKQMAADGFPVSDELLARLSSSQDEHINFKVREAGRVEVAEGPPGVGGPSPSTRSASEPVDVARASRRVGPQVVKPAPRGRRPTAVHCPGPGRGRCRGGDHGLAAAVRGQVGSECHRSPAALVPGRCGPRSPSLAPNVEGCLVQGASSSCRWPSARTVTADHRPEPAAIAWVYGPSSLVGVAECAQDACKVAAIFG